MHQTLIFIEWIEDGLKKMARGRRHEGLTSGGEVKRHFLTKVCLSLRRNTISTRQRRWRPLGEGNLRGEVSQVRPHPLRHGVKECRSDSG